MTDAVVAGEEGLIDWGRRAFEFLEHRGWSRGSEHHPDMERLTYRGPELSFELELDWREQTAFLLVCRTVDGHLPGGYYSDQGRRVRLHLADALSSTGVLTKADAASFRETQRVRGAAGMRAQIDMFATKLRASLDALLEQSDAIFS